MANYKSTGLVLIILLIVAVPLIYDQYQYTTSITAARQAIATQPVPVYKLKYGAAAGGAFGGAVGGAVGGAPGAAGGAFVGSVLADRAFSINQPSLSNVPREPASVKLEKQSTYVSMNDAIHASLDDHLLRDHRFL